MDEPDKSPPADQAPARPAIDPGSLIATATVFGVTAIVLTFMGRDAWCACNSWNPASFDVWSSHNSQHLLDPYTFSHVLHGVVFFGMLWPLRERIGLGWRATISAALEATWEVAENTNTVIERYRENTASLDYFGDSMLNSMADIVSCLAGFALAASIPWFASVGFFVAVEVVLLLWIKDSLLLNVIMLVYPLEIIKQWQMGG